MKSPETNSPLGITPIYSPDDDITEIGIKIPFTISGTTGYFECTNVGSPRVLLTGPLFNVPPTRQQFQELVINIYNHLEPAKQKFISLDFCINNLNVKLTPQPCPADKILFNDLSKRVLWEQWKDTEEYSQLINNPGYILPIHASSDGVSVFYAYNPLTGTYGGGTNITWEQWEGLQFRNNGE